MPRKHLFVLVVLLTAAAFGSLLALSRGGTAGATAAPSQGALAARERSLDQLEAAIRRSLAEQPAAVPAAAGTAPRTVFVRPVPRADGAGGDEEHDHEDEGDDD